MKRAIFRKHSIDVCIEHGILSTPIGSDALPFTVGEPIIVATPKSEATADGEYQFLFTIGEYVGDRSDLGNELFQRPDWRHCYRITAISRIEPFSLADVVDAAGDEGDAVHYRYKGQTQHHRIIRTVLPEHEPLWNSFVRVAPDPVASAVAVVAANQADQQTRDARKLTRDRIVRRLRAMDKQNAGLAPGREYRPGKTQHRNREFSALLRALYGGRCQVCGTKIESPDGSRVAAQVHHVAPWDGGHSDRLANVICLCPNHHSMFELGAMRWEEDQLREWADDGWQPRPLAVDEHLTTPFR